ncbi:dual OB domain-containing protein [Rhodothermus marinus]|uniref:Dual OB-containing domain-containing protein n=1 Tax=Rhodothermus marinus (strain ATCC 43812 / DSM 4252 / R-10) TaxID=518766 RepID=D0MKP5_RHOM4|nr:hypothetical protein [Rhodothermus marinus]ACY49709.1 hypothetical protein Rmar_2842 [Rhodothermus marinus DSM 4252]
MRKLKVLIVARTRTNNDQLRCIGGLAWEDTEANCYSVRLLNPDNLYRRKSISKGLKGFWETSSPYRIGHLWEITIREPDKKIPPHVEDVIVEDARIRRKFWMSEMYDKLIDLLEKSRSSILWRGSPSVLFDRKIQFNVNGKGYIDKSNIPSCSTGFWLPDKDLHRCYDFNNKLCYCYKGDSNEVYYLPYVGVFKETPPVLKKDTLIRVSLSRWFGEPERCWLMMSGWFEPPTVITL